MFSKMCKPFEGLQSIKFRWQKRYVPECKEACLLPCNLAPDIDKPDSARVHQHYAAFDLIYPASTDKQPWSTAPQDGGCLLSSKHRQRKQTICVHLCQHIQSALLKILAVLDHSHLSFKMHSYELNGSPGSYMPVVSPEAIP